MIGYLSVSVEDAARRHAAADYSLLVRPAHHGPQKQTDSVNLGAVANLFAPDGDDVLLPTTPLTVRKPGAGPL